MKLIVAIVHNDDARTVVDALLRHEFRATRLNSSGGFLRKSNATLLIGVEEPAVEEVIAVIREHARRRTSLPANEAAAPSGRRADLGAAVVFVIELDGYVRL